MSHPFPHFLPFLPLLFPAPPLSFNLNLTSWSMTLTRCPRARAYFPQSPAVVHHPTRRDVELGGQLGQRLRRLSLLHHRPRHRRQVGPWPLLRGRSVAAVPPFFSRSFQTTADREPRPPGRGAPRSSSSSSLAWTSPTGCAWRRWRRAIAPRRRACARPTTLATAYRHACVRDHGICVFPGDVLTSWPVRSFSVARAAIRIPACTNCSAGSACANSACQSTSSGRASMKNL